VSDNKDLLQIGILLISSLILLTVFKDIHYLNKDGKPFYPKSPIDLDNINVYFFRNIGIFLMIATFVFAITAFAKATILSSLITIRNLIKRQISITHIEYVNIGITFIAVTVFILLSIWFTIIPVIIPIIFIVIISILGTKTKKERKDNSNK
jgi:uncharacterized protein YacL